MLLKTLILTITFCVTFIAYASNEAVENSKKKAVVFDWDDTLIPSTLIKLECSGIDSNFNVEDLREVRSFYNDEWMDLDNLVTDIFKSLRDRYEIFIISNASMVWIELTFEIFLPKAYKYIKEITRDNVLVSARDRYLLNASKSEITGVKKLSSKPWKVLAFQSLLQDYSSVLSIGDSYSERFALFSIDCSSDAKKTKISVKLLDEPATIEDLLEQLKFIFSNWSTLEHEDFNKDSYISEYPHQFLSFEDE